MALYLKSAHDGRKLTIELHVDYGADYLSDTAICSGHGGGGGGKTPGLRGLDDRNRTSNTSGKGISRGKQSDAGRWK